MAQKARGQTRESPRTPDQESWVPYATNYPTHLLQQVIKRVACPTYHVPISREDKERFRGLVKYISAFG